MLKKMHFNLKTNELEKTQLKMNLNISDIRHYRDKDRHSFYHDKTPIVQYTAILKMMYIQRD